jgi:hypothetical protein
MGVVRKETKMVHKVRRQDARWVRGQRQRDEMESMPGLTLTDPWETATAPRRATSASSRPRTAPSCASSSSRRGPSVPGNRVCAASRRQNRDGARPTGRGAMHLYGAVDDFEAVGRQHLQVLQFFQVRVANLALGAMAFAAQTGVASLLHLRRVNENGAANSIRRYRQGECRRGR